MTPELQTFLNSCQNIPEIVSVTAEDPTPVMMAQVESSFTLTQLPVLFHFMVKDSTGVAQPIDIIVPYEVFTKIQTPPVAELVAGADRHREVPAYGIRFVHPDGSDGYPLVGHEWAPIADPTPELTSLLTAISELEHVESVTAHNLVDPDLIAQTGSTSGIRIVANIKGLTDPDSTKDGYFHDYCNFIMSNTACSDTNTHAGIIESVTANIATILAKEKLC